VTVVPGTRADGPPSGARWPVGENASPPYSAAKEDGGPPIDVDVESAAFLETVLNASRDCIKVLSMDGELLFMNRGGLAVMEIDDFETVRGSAWQSFWKGDFHQAALDAVSLAKSGGTGQFTGLADTLRGSPRWWDVTVTPIFGGGGTRPSHLLSISRDITATRTVQLQSELLSLELNHRVKNLLAIVGAIASQTFTAADRASVDAFTARLVALGDAQGLLVNTAWQSASITEIVDRGLLPHAPEGRASRSGPDLILSAKEALALALAIHELATNAVKYGSLSNASGSIDVAWAVNEDRLTFRWTESGGPDVETPSRSGFGSRIIKRNLAGEFKGDVDVDYRPTGLVLTLTASR